jgi:hypothetical protein
VLQIEPSRDGHRLAVIRQEIPGIDFYDLASGEYLTSLTPPWLYGVPASVNFSPAGAIVSAWGIHAMTRETPAFVSVHNLPRSFDEALAAAKARLAAMEAVWTPAGPPQSN